MEIQGVILVVIIAAIMLFVISYSLGVRRREIAANVEREIRSTADFSADDVYVSPHDRHGLAIDNTRGLVMLIDATRRRTVSFEKLVSAEVMEDNVTLMTTKKGLGRVVVGGLLAGGVGAIVGGLTGRQTSKSSTGVRSITLVVVIDDFNAPRHSVTFIKWPIEEGLSRNSSLYRRTIEKAQLWQGRLTIAMRHAEEFKSSPERASTTWESTQTPARASAPTAIVRQAPAIPAYRVVARRYRILKPLGGGAMKKVYLAEDSRLAWRRCALAEMLDNYSNSQEQQEAVRAFQRECDLLATLDNAHIPKIYDHFSEEHRHYLVMEYVEGATLEEILSSAGQAFDENAVVELARQILDTLSYLHHKSPSVLYRDLKPSNIMITADGQVKLIDFGIARTFEPATKMTIIGTQGYAAPEQYQGKAETRSDIYGLGAVMHHALTGRDPALEAPFSFPSVADLLPAVQPRLAALVDQALSYEIDKRPRSANEMKEQLAPFGFALAPQIALQNVSTRFTAVAEEPVSARVTRLNISFCPNCGTRLAQDDRACTSCSTIIRPDSQDLTNFYDLRAGETLKKLSATASNRPLLSYTPFYVIVGSSVLFMLVAWITSITMKRTDVPETAVPAATVSAESVIMSESEKAANEKRLLAQVGRIPASDREGNILLYRRLVLLRPDNKLYREKLDHYYNSRLASKSVEESKPTTTGGFTYDQIDEGLAAICTTLILDQYHRRNFGQDESGDEMAEQTKDLICRHYKICGEKARKLAQATAHHFGGWDEVARMCESNL